MTSEKRDVTALPLDAPVEAPPMSHYALTADVYCCGLPRDPAKPFRRIANVDCVVCHDIWWNSMTTDDRIEIKRRRGSLR